VAAERRAVEAAVCHMQRGPEGDPDGSTADGSTADGSLPDGNLRGATGLRPLVAKLQASLAAAAGSAEAEGPLLLALEPWAALAEVVAVDQVLEWQAWSTLFLW
jgi:hypothetical protein